MEAERTAPAQPDDLSQQGEEEEEEKVDKPQRGEGSVASPPPEAERERRPEAPADTIHDAEAPPHESHSVGAARTGSKRPRDELEEETKMEEGEERMEEEDEENGAKKEPVDEPVEDREEAPQEHEEDAQEEEDGEIEEQEHRPPILDGRNIIFKTRLLSDFLVCKLCMGVLRDAHTIRECLHTFCKSCLYKYFQTTADCPLCGVDLRPNPFERIRFDRTVQTIVNKIFSDLVEQDIAKEASFYRARGMIEEAERVESILLKTQESKAPKPPTEVAQPASKRLKRDPSKPIYRDEVAFELTLDEGEPELRPLEKPVIRTSARVTVRHLKKFVGMKLALSNVHDLEITYKGEVLGTEHSLEYILKTRGYEGGAIEFKYRNRRNIM